MCIPFQKHFGEAKSLGDTDRFFRNGSEIIGTLALCRSLLRAADLVSLTSESLSCR